MKLELDDKEAEFLMRVLVNEYASDTQDFDLTDIGDPGVVGILIGKIIQSNRSMQKVYHQAKDIKRVNSGRLAKYLFMGAGWKSIVDKNKLHKRIDCAARALGSIQQNGGMGTEFDDDRDNKNKQLLKEVALDVLEAFSLTVEDIK